MIKKVLISTIAAAFILNGCSNISSIERKKTTKTCKRVCTSRYIRVWKF